MSELTFPGDDAPSFCPFVFDYPDDWAPELHAYALAVVAEPERGNGAFRSNVVVGASRLPAETSLDEAVAAAASDAGDLADLTVIQEEAITVDGIAASMRLVGFYASGRPEPLAQLRVLLFAPQPAGPVHDLFRIHATCPAERSKDHLPLFKGVVESFRFAPGIGQGSGR